MIRIYILIQSLLLIGAAVSGNFAFADKKPKHSEPTPEMRKSMAEMHQKMADCLNSNKPIKDCRQEMKKACHEFMEKGGQCPMMGSHKGKKHHHDDDHDDDHDED